MLLRVGNMRGVDLNLFEFDYDLQWMAIFLSGDEQVLGRFGSRLPSDANKYRTVEGLQTAMQAALKKHRNRPGPALPPQKPFTVEDYPATAKLGPKACIHCHHVWEFRRESLQSNKQWTKDEVWAYPPPENLGLSLAGSRQNYIAAVDATMPVAKAGMRLGDVLLSVQGQPVASFADVQYALHKSPASVPLTLEWLSDGQPRQAKLKMPKGWRQTDVSWRHSLQSLKPASGLHGSDLSATEKKTLGLSPVLLAFRQGNFLTPQARQAGILVNDLILGIDGKQWAMTVRQLDAHVRLTYQPGDVVTVHLLRDGKRLDLPMKLQ